MPPPSVLIVDDDVGMVETLADIFVAKGYETATAHSGEAAVALVERMPYDVVLMDIQMPGVNGLEAFRMLRTRVPGIRAIMMTAFTRDELVQEAARKEVIAVVPKPLELDHVLTLVQAATATGGGSP